MKKSLIALAILGANIVHSQVTITVDTPPNLVQNVLLGGGITVSGITSQGNPDQFASFTAAPGTPIDFDQGIVLSTFGMTSPDVLQQTGPGYFGAGTPGDPDLSATAGDPTNNAAWIQFDFVPTGDTLEFDYIFMSQEYNFYVNSSFNDVFAFYLTGPNPLGGSYTNQNVAIIPGSGGLPVTINNLNNGQSSGCGAGPCEYCAYYVDNCTPPANGLQTGGYTTNLSVVVPVVACSTYTIKMGVADVVDGALNSAVFLKASSFSSNQVGLTGSVNFGPADTLLYEDCNLGIITFTRIDTSGADTITFTVTGTATMGTDYSTLPPAVIFPPGEDTVQIVLNPFQDFVSEGPEIITLTIDAQICGSSTVTFNYYILDIDSLSSVMQSDTFFCAGSTLLFDAIPQGGIGLYTESWQAPGGGTFNDNTTQTPTQSGYYVYQMNDFCVPTLHYDSIYVEVFPVPNLTLPDEDICSLVGETVGPGLLPAGFNAQWTPSANLSADNVANPTFNAANPGPGDLQFTYYLTVDSGGVACYLDSMVVTLHPSPIVDLGPDTNYCENSFLTLNAGNPGSTYSWSTSATTQTINVNTTGTYAVEVTNTFGCINVDTVNIGIDSLPHFAIHDQIVCEGDSAVMWVPSSEGDIFVWSTLSTDTIIFTFTPGIYYLTVANYCGSTTDTAEVIFKPDLQNIMVPNVMTPNSDGNNDEYTIPALVEAEWFKMEFYNRWGTLLYETDDLNAPWRATSGADGNIVPPGTYFVIIRFRNCKGEEIVKKEFISIFY